MKYVKRLSRQLLLSIFCVLLFTGCSITAFSQALDVSFGSGGRVSIPGSPVKHVLVQGDGKILVGGTRYASGFPANFEIRRYNVDGSSDAQFGNNGSVIVDYGPYDQLADITLQRDGRIVGTGYTSPDNVNRTAVIFRLAPTGNVELIMAIPYIPQLVSEFVAVQDNGRIVLSGWDNRVSRSYIIGLTPSGTLDGSFGEGGLLALADGMRISEFSIDRLSNSWAAGYRFAGGTGYDFCVIKIDPNGHPDPSFGQNGQADYHLKAYDFLSDLTVQNDGKILAVGYTSVDNGDSEIALWRMLPNGEPDITFGSGGIVIDGSHGRSVGSAVVLQPDSKILVAGFMGNNPEEDPIITRYESNGQPDPSYFVHIPETSQTFPRDMLLNGNATKMLLLTTRYVARLFHDDTDTDGDGIPDSQDDSDADGYPATVDCNDADASIFPGAPEEPGTTMDRNCDGALTPCTELVADFFQDFIFEGLNGQIFDASSNIFPMASYLWDFGDGNTSHEAGNISHSFSSAGDYNVSLTITQGECSAQVSKIVHVLPQPIITLTVAEGCAGTFSDATVFIKNYIEGLYCLNFEGFGKAAIKCAITDVDPSTQYIPKDVVFSNTALLKVAGEYQVRAYVVVASKSKPFIQFSSETQTLVVKEPTVWYPDMDKDGFGNSLGTVVTSCLQPEGFIDNALDCNDSDGALNPGTRWYKDSDGDGLGNPDDMIQQCLAAPGYVSNSDDLNDDASNKVYVYEREISANALGLIAMYQPYVAADPFGNVYVSDAGHRVYKFDVNGNFVLQFGMQGTGDGEFTGPEALTTDANGNIFVVDQSRRVQVFNSSGVYLRSFPIAGGNVRGMAIDGQGNLYLTDVGAHKVSKYNSQTGALLLQFGSNGSGPGQFNMPWGIAIDGSDNVFVAEYLGRRIQKFDSQGTFSTAFTSSGSGSSSFGVLRGIAIHNDRLLVVDEGAARIHVLGLDGTFVSSFGSSGTGDGQFNFANNVSTDSEGNVFVAEWNNNRIQKFDPSGNFELRFGVSVNSEGLLRYPTRIETTPSNEVYIYDSPDFEKFSATGTYVSALKNIPNIADFTIDAEGNIYALGEDKIRKFSASGILLWEKGSRGAGDGQFNQAIGIAIDQQRNLYVADQLNRRVQKFDSNGNFILKWGSPGGGDGQFNPILSIASDLDGRIYVGDNFRVQVFDDHGTFIGKINPASVDPGFFTNPTGIEVDDKGRIFVADPVSYGVLVYDRNYHFLTKIGGSKGTDKSQFNSTVDVAWMAEKVFVTDVFNQRVQIFSAAVDRDGDGFSVDDCDDADASIYPGAPELCDHRDNNCDGIIDNGCSPVMEVSFAGAPVPNYYPSHYDVDFGSVDVGNSADFEFQITNSGNADLLIQSAGISGENAAVFHSDMDPASATIAPGGILSFSISFIPLEEGPKAAIVSFSSNAADTPYEFSVSGTGKIVPLPKEPATELEAAEAKMSSAKIAFKKGSGMKRAVLLKAVAVKTLDEAAASPPRTETETEAMITLLTVSPEKTQNTEALTEEVIPVIEDNVKLTGNADFEAAPAYKGYKVVYVGEGTEVEVMALKPATTYLALVYEFNERDGLTRYLNPPAAVEFSTLPGVEAPSSASTDLVMTPASTTSLLVSLTPGNGQNRLAVIRRNFAPSFLPSEDVLYSQGETVMYDETIVYTGTESSFIITDLLPNTTYFISVFEYNADTEYFVYLTETFASASATTFAVPTATLTGDFKICTGEVALLTIDLAGHGPWTGTYSINGEEKSFVAGAEGDNAYSLVLSVSPEETTSYQLTSVADIYASGIADGSATVVVNESPVLTALNVSLDPKAMSTPVQVSGTYTDSNLREITVDWGDGTSEGVLFGDGQFSAVHSYTSAGVYTLAVKLTDECQVESTNLHQYIVIYDPSAGFVTGGGWFTSPAGAYVPNPNATGKASFGFVAKYKKGSTVPDGNTDFQFQAGDLKFKSTAYQWLVIAGYKAMYKGVGELNETAGYGFLISGVDGAKKSYASPDKFRIKIWDAAGITVYDNQMGSADDAEANTMLGGGSIVIHDGKTTPSGTSTDNSNAGRIRDAGATAEAEGATAYPNPFSQYITLVVNSVTQDDFHFQLIDATGKLVYDKDHLFDQRGVYSLDLNKDNLPTGLYLLKINQGRSVQYLRMMKK